MFEMLVAILLAIGCPVPPNLPHGPGTIMTTQGDEDVDTGGDDGHLPPPPPPHPIRN